MVPWRKIRRKLIPLEQEHLVQEYRKVLDKHLEHFQNCTICQEIDRLYYER